MPSLKDLHEKEERLKKKLAENHQSIVLSQAFEYGQRSNSEYVLYFYICVSLQLNLGSRRSKIHRLEKEILKLADKMEVTLGRPPAPPETEKS